jgi:hypothetical protein
LLSRDVDGSVRGTHYALPDDPTQWKAFAESQHADVLWVDGNVGPWCSVFEPDEVMVLVRPSITEMRLLASGLKRQAGIIAITCTPNEISTETFAADSANFKEILGQDAVSLQIHHSPYRQLINALHSNEDELPIDGGTIQRIVTHVIDSEALGKTLRPAIEAALSRLLDDPDGTYDELTRLAALHPHPDTLLAAMKFFRFQPRADRLPLTTAVNYWKMTGDAAHTVLGDLLLFSLEHRADDVPTDFLIAVADAQHAQNDALAIAASGHLDPQIQTEARAIVRLLDPLLLDGRATIELLAQYLPALAIASGAKAAHDVAQRHANRYRNNPAFHVAWASAALRGDDEHIIRDMLAHNAYNNMLVSQHDPQIARRLSERMTPNDPGSANALVNYDGFLLALREGHSSVSSPDSVAKAVYDLHRLNRLDGSQQLAFVAALEVAAKRWAKRSYMQRLWQKLPIELDALVPLRLRS